MDKAAVIGCPIAHSLSPKLHQYWIEKYGISGTYEAVEIKSDNLEEGVKGLIDHGYTGFNVTIPHKEAIVPLVDDIDDFARLIGAVNTVVINNGKLLGKNTDAYGFIENIRQQVHDIDFVGKKALVLGAGGAARAVIVGLLKENVATVCITNRTIEKAQALANEFQPVGECEVIPWEEKEVKLQEMDLVINTTSLGMDHFPPLDFNLSSLSEKAVVVDIVYKPLETKLLKEAKEKGVKAVDGLGMLLYQAVPAFEAWFNIKPEVTPELRKYILSEGGR